MMSNILPGIDDEITQALRKSLEKKGIKIFTSSKVISIQSGDKAVCTFENNGKEQSVDGDIAIVAIGRKPNSENIGLENVKIDLREVL